MASWLTPQEQIRFNQRVLSGGFAIGDLVEFWLEDLEGLSAEKKRGIIRDVKADGDLQIPGTSLKLKGTSSDPAAQVQEVEGEEDEPEDRYYLVPFSCLRKAVDL